MLDNMTLTIFLIISAIGFIALAYIPYWRGFSRQKRKLSVLFSVIISPSFSAIMAGFSIWLIMTILKQTPMLVGNGFWIIFTIAFIFISALSFMIYAIWVWDNFQKTLFIYLTLLSYYVALFSINMGLIEILPDKFSVFGLIFTCFTTIGSFFPMYQLLKKRFRKILHKSDGSIWKTLWLIPAVILVIVGLTYYNILTSHNLSALVLLIILMAAFYVIYKIVFKMEDKTIENNELASEMLFTQERLLKAQSDIVATQEEIILAFAEISESKSGQTGQHIKRVSEYARVMASGYGYSASEVENIRIASMMHDIGKLLIPPEILEKPGKLTKEEFEIIKTHVTIGEALLKNSPGKIMGIARKIALEHHERYDGTGYLGKKKDEIDITSRLISIVDVFDALVSRRSYKAGWAVEDAYEEIIQQKGRQFDPLAVDVFVVHFSEILDVFHRYPDQILESA